MSATTTRSQTLNGRRLSRGQQAVIYFGVEVPTLRGDTTHDLCVGVVVDSFVVTDGALVGVNVHEFRGKSFRWRTAADSLAW
jgi:hypothetical protein